MQDAFLLYTGSVVNTDPGWKNRIRDLGWKKIGSGINIPDPQH
jgi:hypothetical protein